MGEKIGHREHVVYIRERSNQRQVTCLQLKQVGNDTAEKLVY